MVRKVLLVPNEIQKNQQGSVLFSHERLRPMISTASSDKSYKKVI